MSEYKECAIVDGQVRPCVSLLKLIDEKNIRFLQVLKEREKTGEQHTIKTRGITMYLGTSEWKKRGIVMNYCPFCGKPVYAGGQDKKEEGNV